jgi:alkylhydroperoxidase family enzyme
MPRRRSLSWSAAGLLAAFLAIHAGPALADEGAGQRPRVEPLTTAEAWRCLPTAEPGANQPLPIWARVLARSLPRTTAAMLDLDRLHRSYSPLGPGLAGKLRWVAADANRCEYSRAFAAADLRRAGIDDAGIRALAGDHRDLPSPEAAALDFARKLTLTADQVTDQEVARLMTDYGPAKVTAMVLLLAHANFQDRLLLALDVPVEPGGPLAPLEVRFSRSAATIIPGRIKPRGNTAPAVSERVEDPEWASVDFGELRKSMAGQKARPGRIAVPSWDDVQKALPPGYPAPKRPLRIRWSLVCLGYQPALAAGWSACTRAFGEEASQDRVFEESLFWVVTRQIHCFY